MKNSSSVASVTSGVPPLTATVIVPVYNRAHLISRCLDSIYAQDYRPLRLIVVDNNSSDNTLATVNEWVKTHNDPSFQSKVIIERRPGAAAAREAGFTEAYGSAPDHNDVVFFFDSDDCMRPRLVSRAMEQFHTNPDTGMVVWRISTLFLDGNSAISKLIPTPLSIQQNLVHSFLSTQRYATRADLFASSGGWDPGVMVWDDWELGTRLLLQNPIIKVINEPLADVYAQTESITGTGFAPKAGVWEKIIDLLEREIKGSDRSDRESLCRVLDYRRVILAAHYSREGHQELARPLLHATLAMPRLSALQRAALRFAYHYTARGLRGAYTLIGPLL